MEKMMFVQSLTGDPGTWSIHRTRRDLVCVYCPDCSAPAIVFAENVDKMGDVDVDICGGPQNVNLDRWGMASLGMH